MNLARRSLRRNGDNDVMPSVAAGFVIARAGDILTPHGLPKVPSAEAICMQPDGSAVDSF